MSRVIPEDMMRINCDIEEYQNLKDITDYMAAHKSDADADELWQYFQDVINWVQKIFRNTMPI